MDPNNVMCCGDWKCLDPQDVHALEIFPVIMVVKNQTHSIYNDLYEETQILSKLKF